MAKCVVKLMHFYSGPFYAMRAFPQIPILCNYGVILIILCAPIGLSVKNDTNASLQSTTLSTSSTTELHSTITNIGNASSRQADNVTVKNQPADDHTPDPVKSDKVSNIHEDIPIKTFERTEQDHNLTVSTVASKPPTSLKATTILPMVVSTTTVNLSSRIEENHDTSTILTLPIHRKSKPEGTHVDDEGRDSGPTTDYVVPLVIAMLAVPLVGVLCALLYLKGRDFWERRHYGRIDFLWDNRNDSRMDFLIDGMYNN